MAQKRNKASWKRGTPARSANEGPQAACTAAQAPSANVDAAWTRGAVTFRLTEQRKRALCDLLQGVSELHSPTAALDNAIALASAAWASDADHPPVTHRDQTDIAVLADELRDAVSAFAGAANEWRHIRTQLACVATDCAELRAAVVASAMPSDGVTVNDTDAPVPLGAWLNRQAGPATAWLVAKASWLGKRPACAGLATWELEASELGRDGQGPTLQSESCRVSLGPAPADGPLTRIDASGGCVLSCARSGQQWRVSLRCASENGKLSVPFAELSV